MIKIHVANVITVYASMCVCAALLARAQCIIIWHEFGLTKNQTIYTNRVSFFYYFQFQLHWKHPYSVCSHLSQKKKLNRELISKLLPEIG